jgi:hypothetical protein
VTEGVHARLNLGVFSRPQRLLQLVCISMLCCTCKRTIP